jgi:thiamine kinase-like enzyme
MDDASLTPTPDARQPPDPEIVRIIERLEPILGEAAGDVAPLEGGITNRNYTARLGRMDYVIRVPGKDTSLLEIDRSVERLANESAARLGIAPEVAAALDDPECIVTVFVEGVGMSAPALREPEARQRIATALRAFHDSGEDLGSAFDSFRIVETYAKTATERGTPIPDAFGPASEHARDIEAALRGPEHAPVPCHNDLLAANFINTPEGIRIVDWEYAGMGNRYFDLANFAINNELDEGQQHELLESYFGEPPTPARFAALGLMRFMSDFREAMWGVVQAGVSELDFDFTDYANTHFERMQKTANDPSFERSLAEARAAEG